MGSEVWFAGYEAAYNEADDKVSDIIAEHEKEIEQFRYKLAQETMRRITAEGEAVKLKKAIAPFAEAGKWIWRYNSNYGVKDEASVMVSDLVRAHIIMKEL